MDKVAVAILNWNGSHFLEEFLPSVIQHSDSHPIYVIDNGSTDDSISIVKNNFPSVKIIALDKNYGFCEGYNRGLKEIHATYYILLNSDIEVTSGWIDTQLEVLEKDSSIVACQPKILSYKQKSHFEHAGAAGGFIDILGYPFCRGRIFHIAEEDQSQYETSCDIFWATGACLFIRSTVFHSLNGFDPSFFAHMEEIDLCWRIKNAGHRIVYVHTAHVYHVGGGTLSQSNPRKTFLNFRNGLALLLKNLPSYKVIPILFIRMLLDGVAFIEFIIIGDGKHAWAIFKAHLSFYRLLPRFLKHRRKAQQFSKTYKHKETYQRSIVFDFFIKKRKTYSDLSIEK